MTEIHHKAQPQHVVSTPFHCSNLAILPSFFTSKNFSGRLAETPPFLGFTMHVRIAKNTPNSSTESEIETPLIRDADWSIQIFS